MADKYTRIYISNHIYIVMMGARGFACVIVIAHLVGDIEYTFYLSHNTSDQLDELFIYYDSFIHIYMYIYTYIYLHHSHHHPFWLPCLPSPRHFMVLTN